MQYPMESLVGPVTQQQMRFVEIFPSQRMILAVPVLGQCEYATSPAHTHPGYMVLVSSDLVPMPGFNEDLGPIGFQMRALPPNVPHQEMPSDMPHRYYAMFFDALWFEELAAQHGVKAKSFYWEPYVASERLLRHIREFMQECELQAADSIRDAMALLIAVEILRGMGNPKGSEIPSVPSALRRVIEELEHRYAKEWSLDELANLACMSPSTLLRNFKSSLGCSPMQYLLRIRVGRVQQLLRMGHSVADCAQRTGFASASHLSEAFRKQTGMSPLTYRKRHMSV